MYCPGLDDRSVQLAWCAISLIWQLSLHDAIVPDLMMPALSGRAFIERYLNHSGGISIPIVVVSAAGAITRSMESRGVRYFLAKPFDLQQLVRSVIDVTSTPGRAPPPQARRRRRACR